MLRNGYIKSTRDKLPEEIMREIAAKNLVVLFGLLMIGGPFAWFQGFALYTGLMHPETDPSFTYLTVFLGSAAVAVLASIAGPRFVICYAGVQFLGLTCSLISRVSDTKHVPFLSLCLFGSSVIVVAVGLLTSHLFSSSKLSDAVQT